MRAGSSQKLLFGSESECRTNANLDLGTFKTRLRDRINILLLVEVRRRILVMKKYEKRDYFWKNWPTEYGFHADPDPKQWRKVRSMEVKTAMRTEAGLINISKRRWCWPSPPSYRRAAHWRSQGYPASSGPPPSPPSDSPSPSACPQARPGPENQKLGLSGQSE